MAEQRCVQWYNKQPDPKIYTGKSQNSPFIISTRSREARQITLSWELPVTANTNLNWPRLQRYENINKNSKINETTAQQVLEERSFITMFLGTPNWWYSLFTDDISLLSCPQTFLQAMADRGRFMLDEYCNPNAEQHFALYCKEAMHCFSTINPRWICIFETKELSNWTWKHA